MNNNLRAKLSSRALSMLIVMALLSFGIGATFAATSGTEFTNVVMNGSGTTEDPYQITDCVQLQAMIEHPDKIYLLQNDIDCANSATLNDNAGFIPIANFTGNLHGRTRAIQNLTITADRTNLGLFETISESSTVQDLYIDGIDVVNSASNPDSNARAGILAGVNAGTISNVKIGAARLTSDGALGGMVGANEGSIDKATTSTATTLIGTLPAVLGGIAAINSGSITNSFANTATSSLSQISTCGGLVGDLQGGSIETSFSNGDMECLSDASGSVGGLVGVVTGNGSTITNSFTTMVQRNNNFFDGMIVGNNAAGIALDSTYYDAQYAGPTPCDNNGNSTCHAVNIGGAYPNYFKNNTTNAPLDTFDFDSVWEVSSTSLPTPQFYWLLTPRSPLYFSADITEGNIALNWQEPFNDTGMDFTGYQVSYSTDGGQSYTTIETTEKNAVISDLDLNLPYSVRVRARNVNGLGSPTYAYEIRALPTKIAEPTYSNVLSRALTLNWDDVSDVADSYVVQYKKTVDSEWKTYTRTNYPSPSSVIYPLDQSTSYDFRVAAANERGTGEYSDQITASTTTQNSYEISTCEELQNINQDLFGNYTLTNDIDCSETSEWNEGAGFEPMGGFMQGMPFSGELHGDNHKITALYMNQVGLPAGLFMAIDGATIDNLTFDGGQIAGSRANDGTVYTDIIVNPLVGTLSAIAANSAIDNVNTNIDFRSNATEGFNGGAGGLIGLTMPAIFGPGTDVTAMSITNSSSTGDIQGFVSGGLVGASFMANIYGYFTGEMDGLNGYEDIFSMVGAGISLTISDSSTSGDLSCTVMCGGFVGASIGDLTLDNVTRSGTTGEVGAVNPSMGPDLDDLIAMLMLSGPVSGGLVGASLPISLDGGTASMTVSDSQVSGNVVGTLASAIVGIALPSISIDMEQMQESISEDDLFPQILAIATDSIENMLSTDALYVENSTSSADINCTVACGGVTTLSLAKTLIENVSVSGDIVNDNSPLIDASSPISFCPIQITGGIIGAQLLFPLSISNSNSTGDISVNQAGDASQIQLEDYLSEDFSKEDLLGLACVLGNVAQGTGGIIGSFISPFEISTVLENMLEIGVDTLAPLELSINETTASGDVDSNAQSFTGGLAGVTFGKSLINNSSASGDVSNSTFADMFRTPIASAATGGLIGSTLGGFSVNGDIIPLVSYLLGPSDIFSENAEEITLEDITSALQVNPEKSIIQNSNASGDVYSSNSAGGLIGNVAGITRVEKSYATGDVYGVAAGGLIGSGFNMGSLLGVLNIVDSIDIENTYARGNVFASSDPDTVTFAGGLVGMMAHFGQINIDKSYATGTIGINNDATDTRLVAGGLVGAELDLSALPNGYLLFNASANEAVQSYIDILASIGLEQTYGASIKNSFTTSSVPAHSQGDDMLLSEITTGDLSDYKSTGSLFGFVFGLDINSLPEFPDLSDQEPITGDELGTYIEGIHWNTVDDLVSNTFYDESKNNTGKCGNSLPSVTQYLEDLYTVASDPDTMPTQDDIATLIPKLVDIPGTSCVAINSNGSQESYFKNNIVVAPLDVWSFNADNTDTSGVWYSHTSDFPTFTAGAVENATNPPENESTDPPPATQTSNPIDSDEPFIPTKVPTKEDFADAVDQIKDIIPDDPAEVLPNIIEKIDAEITKNAEDELKPDDTGLLSTIVGILTATGAFLLRHLLEAVLIILLGAALTFIARKEKVFDRLRKP